MSLFKFGNLEAEIDFTDVLFLENLEDAKQAMKEEAARVPKTGKTADIIRAQCQCYFNFFDRVIREGAHEEMFQGKISLNACLDAADELLKFENDEATKLNGRYSEYTIQQHGNRQQRRNYNKQHGKKQNKGTVVGIVAICYVIGLGCKAYEKIPDKWIPVIMAVCGGVLGVAGLYTMPDFPAGDVINAVAVGMASGLAATGVNQLYKQQCK